MKDCDARAGGGGCSVRLAVWFPCPLRSCSSLSARVVGLSGCRPLPVARHAPPSTETDNQTVRQMTGAFCLESVPVSSCPLHSSSTCRIGPRFSMPRGSAFRMDGLAERAKREPRGSKSFVMPQQNQTRRARDRGFDEKGRKEARMFRRNCWAVGVFRHPRRPLVSYLATRAA